MTVLYVKGVPFVNGGYAKGVYFLPKMVYKIVRGRYLKGPFIKIFRTHISYDCIVCERGSICQWRVCERGIISAKNGI